jgi:hypothetical protein
MMRKRRRKKKKRMKSGSQSLTVSIDFLSRDRK